MAHRGSVQRRSNYTYSRARNDCKGLGLCAGLHTNFYTLGGGLASKMSITSAHGKPQQRHVSLSASMVNFAGGGPILRLKTSRLNRP